MAPLKRRDDGGFGRWLDISMSNAHLSGREVASRIGVHDSAVSRWRSGKGGPTMEAVTALADMFSVDPLRLAVRAKLISQRIAGVEPAEMPEPKAQREEVRKSIMIIPGLTSRERQALLERYDEMVQGVESE